MIDPLTLHPPRQISTSLTAGGRGGKEENWERRELGN